MRSPIASTNHECERAKKRPKKAPVADAHHADPEVGQMKLCDVLLCLIERRLLEGRGHARRDIIDPGRVLGTESDRATTRQ